MSYQSFSFLPVLKVSTLTAAASEAVQGVGSHSAYTTGDFVGLFVIIAFFVLLALGLVVLSVVSLWKVYEKAGLPGWASLVPFYNNVKLIEITNRPYWWIFMLCIPVVNIFFTIEIYYRLARAFGKGGWFTAGLILLPFIFLPILAFGKSEYSNTFPLRPEMSEQVKYSLVAFTVWVLGMIFLNSSNINTPTKHSLTILSSSGYATDGQYVYDNDVVIPGADPASFKLNGSYGQDDYTVYYDGKVIHNANADTFQVLDANNEYAKDDTAVYYGGESISADVNTFVVVPANKNLPYDYGFAKDSAHVYVDGVAVDGADPATYVSLGNDYAKDKAHVFYYGSLVPQADLATFTVIDTGISSDLSAQSYDAKDKNHRYSSGEVVGVGALSKTSVN